MRKVIERVINVVLGLLFILFVGRDIWNALYFYYLVNYK